jgi:hypothetical protein
MRVLTQEHYTGNKMFVSPAYLVGGRMGTSDIESQNISYSMSNRPLWLALHEIPGRGAMVPVVSNIKIT